MSFFLTGSMFMSGAVVASFVGVVVARINTGQGFLTGRSRCDMCNATLAPSALMPVISFIASKGRARCCSARVNFLAPLTELLLGVLFALSYLKLGLSISLLGILLSLSALLALVLYDLAHQILPPVLLSVFVVASALAGFLLASSFTDFLNTLFTAFCIALFLAIIHFFSRGRAMGLSDAPLAFGLALLVGPSAITGFIFSFWIGALIGIVLLLKRPKSLKMNSEVPFAPFLAAGFLLAFFTQWNIFTLVTGLL